MDAIDRFADSLDVVQHVFVDDAGFRDIACRWQFDLYELLGGMTGEYDEDTDANIEADEV